MSTFETNNELYATASRNALSRIAVFLHGGSEAPKETMLGAFEDPATVLASIGSLDKATLEALAVALRDRTHVDAERKLALSDVIDGRVNARVRAGDRRTIEAIELFARRHEAHHDYVRTLAEMAGSIGDEDAKRHFTAKWLKALESREAHAGLDFRARYAGVILHAIEAKLEGRWIAS